MKRPFTCLAILAAMIVLLLALTGSARACPPVAPAQFGINMGYGAPVGVAPAIGSYGVNVGISPGYAAPVMAGFGAAPLYGSPGFGVGLGGYGVSSGVGFGAVPAVPVVQNRVAVIHGRPGLFQRLRARRLLRRGF